MRSSGDSRRAEADATDRDALPGFHSWGAEAASLCLQGSPVAPLCGEERCAGSIWTNDVRGDASKTLLVSLQAASFASFPCRGRVIAA